MDFDLAAMSADQLQDIRERGTCEGRAGCPRGRRRDGVNGQRKKLGFRQVINRVGRVIACGNHAPYVERQRGCMREPGP
jgi:hypothetical protein